MSPETNDVELTALARTLATLAPAGGGLKRDELMYRAGRAAAASQRGWFWPATALGLAVLTAALELTLAARPTVSTLIQTLVVPVPERETPAATVRVASAVATVSGAVRDSSTEPLPGAPSSYQLEQVALRAGIEAVPDGLAHVTSGSSQRTEEILSVRDTSNLLDLQK
jgi:hypothetical protein